MRCSSTATSARRSIRAVLPLLAATGLLLAATPAQAAEDDRCAGSTTEPSASTTDEATDAVVCLVNVERARRGLRALRRDGDLGQAARRHAADMVRRTFFSHVTPGGSTLSDRLRNSGYIHGGISWHVGEALGWGTGARSTPSALLDEWLASPPHRRILLDDSFRELGVGVAPGAPQGSAGATYTVDVGVVRGA